VHYLDQHQDVAVVGPRLLYPDGRTQPSRRRFPTAATLFAESTQLQRFWPRNEMLRHFYVEDRSDDEEQDVDWLAGACLCVRGQAAREVGLFDERFFMYSEELDWCRRFKAAGWRVVYLPTAQVSHVEGASTARTSFTGISSSRPASCAMRPSGTGHKSRWSCARISCSNTWLAESRRRSR
jgi:N-acetylglucosaminyl-diphospho-decaprenol L-rhamnosyltransferase